MNKVRCIPFLVISLALVNPAFALEDDTLYLGASAGFAHSVLNDESEAKSAIGNLTGSSASYSDSVNKGFGRVFAGYNIVNNMGVEVGYSFYQDSSSQVKSNIYGLPVSAKSTNETNAIDLLGVYRFAVQDDISVNFKAGAAYVINKYKVKGDGVLVESDILSSNTKNIVPKLGVGIDYIINEQVAVGASYDYLMGFNKPFKSNNRTGELKKESTYSPQIHSLSVGVTYSF